MTYCDILALLEGADGEVRVSMSKEGTFLSVKGKSHEINEKQAAFLFEALAAGLGRKSKG